jgi:hypothetical protein
MRGGKTMKAILPLCILLVFKTYGSDSTVYFRELSEIELKYESITPIVARIKVTDFSAFPYRETSLWGGYIKGSQQTVPKNFISSMQIWVGKNELHIPVSAFSDLGDPKTVKLIRNSKKSFEIKISGSETGEAYEAVFFFHGLHLKTRKVRHAEIPEAWQETIYSFASPNQ